MPRLVLPDYTVIRDTREKPGYGWTFEPHPSGHRPPVCLGMVTGTLKTGDYSIRGYEDLLAIERKEDFSELWGNYGERERFEAEMEQMSRLKHRYLLVGSHLTPETFSLSPPQYRAGVPGKVLVRWLLSLSTRFGVHVLFVGHCGRQVAQYLMETVIRTEKGLWVPQVKRPAAASPEMVL